MDDKTEQTNYADSLGERFLELHQAQSRLSSQAIDLSSRFDDFSHRFEKLRRRVDSDSSSESSDFDYGDDADWNLGYEENVIHEVRNVDFENFKNRYSDQDGNYCIEVLCAGSDYYEQIRREAKRRGADSDDEGELEESYEDPDDEKIIRAVRIQSPPILFFLNHVLKEALGASWRVWKRQSRTTFYPPFKWFVYVQSQMRDLLQQLEQLHAETNTDLSVESHSQTVAELVLLLKQRSSEAQNVAPSSMLKSSKSPSGVNINESAVDQNLGSIGKGAERQILEQALFESYQSLLALRCYVSFVDERIMPQITRLKSLESLAEEVRFDELYDLFELGELVVFKNRQEPNGAQHQVFDVGRVYRKTVVDVDKQRFNQSQMPGRRKAKPSNESGVRMQFTLNCYKIGFDGQSYVPIRRNILFPFYEGTMVSAALPATPLRCHREYEYRISNLKDRGRTFLDVIKLEHVIYRGWTGAPPPGSPGVHPAQRIPGPPGGGMPIPPHHSYTGDGAYRVPTATETANNLNIAKSDYIESNAIIDVSETIRTLPDWSFESGLQPVPTSGLTTYWSWIREKMPIIHWTDQHRKTKVSTVHDRTLVEDGIGYIESNAWLEQDQFSRRCQTPPFADSDLVLLPSTIYAYALRERKFFVGYTQNFGQIPTEENPFDSLKIKPEHIFIVQSVVSSHFQRKTMEAIPDFQPQMDQDLIRGKGRGLVILLHGAPGVGKTATAEAVALWHRKPRFVITCGDLGFTPEKVESSLSEIFRLAHLWNCILLLDEADVFLSQREANALERNALVSVFLRVLEYYNGILFLTTNRVGTLDEAFRSRVHLSLYYPALDMEQTEQIMRMNLSRLSTIEKHRAKLLNQKEMLIYEKNICDFIVKHWTKHEGKKEGRWNGRQIRNAVQIAASLALYESHKQVGQVPGAQDLPPILDERQFQVVESTMAHFEQYLSKTKGGSSTIIAKQRSEREDNFGTAERSNIDASSLYDPYAAINTGIGGYSPYQNRPRTPQTFGVPPQHRGQQYSTPSASAYGHPTTTSAPYAPPDPTSHIYSQTEGHRVIVPNHAMPGTMPLVQPGIPQYGLAPSYPVVPPQSGTVPPGDQPGGTSILSQGYHPAP
ncbi:hypothetical protein GGR57DRAFT_453834 [Xylariaceae sp. FL1272]|nr:hypothetical protein GGR57DRAFT_453834 [Xylariaceae sp. FL1272]